MSNLLILIGTKAVSMIQRNIDDMIDSDGNTFANYSFGYWFTKYRRKQFKGKKLRGKKGMKWREFVSSSRQGWLGSVGADLTATGRMRASLSAVSTDNKNNSVLIGFLNQESAKIAFYHNVSGAGKGRVLRKFMGLQIRQEQELADYASDLISNDKVFLMGLFKSLGIESN